MIRIADPLPHDNGLYEYCGRFDFDADAAFEFTGRLDFDPELHFEPARWYDPTLGVWMTEDVVGFADDVNLSATSATRRKNSPRQPSNS
jgi:RHS repeat-associated protein